MRLFQIGEQHQKQFAELPEIAMDLNFGQSHNVFYLVVSCRIAIPMDESTFSQPEGTYFGDGTLPKSISSGEASADVQRWYRGLPLLPSLATASPAEAWLSFLGAMGPVSPIYPVPPPPPAAPLTYGHLPFKAATSKDTVIYRWEAFPTSRRIDRTTNPPTIAKDTYAAPASELPFVPTGFGAVARFALPSLIPACYRYELQPVAGTPIECGAAVPLYGQSGGGVEVKFTRKTNNRCAIADPVILPEL